MRSRFSTVHINTEPTWRGGEQQTLYLVDGLQRRGHRAVLCVQRGAPLAARAREEGIETVEIPMHGEIDLLAVFRIARVLRDVRPHLVHFHTSHAHSLGAMAAGLLGNQRPRTLLTRRVVYSIYRHSFFGLNHIKYAKVDRIIAISRAIRDVLVEDGVAADRIEVVPSGIDRARLDVRSVDLRKEVGLPPETSVVVNVAHFAGHKGQRYLVEAAPRILAAQPDTAFFLVGEGEQQPEARSLARRLGVEDRVFFPGFRRDVPGILRGSDVYVTPSHREGLGTSLLDALWCGLPVVASAAGGQTEIVHDGDNGLLVPPQDSAALATATTRLLASSELRSRLGSAGPRVVEEHYTVEKMIEGNLAVYHELIAGAKPQLLPV